MNHNVLWGTGLDLVEPAQLIPGNIHDVRAVGAATSSLPVLCTATAGTLLRRDVTVSWITRRSPGTIARTLQQTVAAMAGAVHGMTATGVAARRIAAACMARVQLVHCVDYHALMAWLRQAQASAGQDCRHTALLVIEDITGIATAAHQQPTVQAGSLAHSAAQGAKARAAWAHALLHELGVELRTTARALHVPILVSTTTTALRCRQVLGLPLPPALPSPVSQALGLASATAALPALAASLPAPAWHACASIAQWLCALDMPPSSPFGVEWNAMVDVLVELWAHGMPGVDAARVPSAAGRVYETGMTQWAVMRWGMAPPAGAQRCLSAAEVQAAFSAEDVPRTVQHAVSSLAAACTVPVGRAVHGLHMLPADTVAACAPVSTPGWQAFQADCVDMDIQAGVDVQLVWACASPDEAAGIPSVPAPVQAKRKEVLCRACSYEAGRMWHAFVQACAAQSSEAGDGGGLG